MAGMNLGQQVGPLPLGAWVAVVGGGLGIAWYTSRNKAPTITTDTSGVSGVGVGGPYTQLTPPTDTTGVTSTTTNEDWGRAAINYLISQGFDPNVADSAVRNYLSAAQLSLQEYALIRYALVKLGSPPVPLPSPPAPPQPAVQPPAAPPPVQTPPGQPSTALRFYFVKPGDSLSKIAQFFYGRSSSWQDIYNANRKGYTRPDGSPGFISNPSYLAVGDKLWVPGW